MMVWDGYYGGQSWFVMVHVNMVGRPRDLTVRRHGRKTGDCIGHRATGSEKSMLCPKLMAFRRMRYVQWLRNLTA